MLRAGPVCTRLTKRGYTRCRTPTARVVFVETYANSNAFGAAKRRMNRKKNAYVKLTRGPWPQWPRITWYGRTRFPLFDVRGTLSARRTRVHCHVSSARHAFKNTNVFNGLVVRLQIPQNGHRSLTGVVTRTTRVPRRPSFESAVHRAIDVTPFLQRIRFRLISAKSFKPF